jgi:sulfite exporter TauE/SafE
MCGPLAVAGCGAGVGRGRRASAYFFGRLVSHLFGGAVFGALGARAAQLLSLEWWQRLALLTVALAALLKGMGLIRVGRLAARSREDVIPSATVKKRSRASSVGALLASMLPRRALPLGLATGALPCGLLAGAWALAASTGDPLSGALSMAAFSLSSAPGLIAGLLVSTPLSRLRWSPALQGALWCALSLWIGLRPFIGHSLHRCH